MLKNKSSLFVKYIIIIFIIFFTNITFANNEKKITIIGNDNIDNEIILSIIENKLTDYSINNLNEIIKILYETGNFKNIESEYLDDEIVLKFEENPTINNIEFIGNKRFKNTDILEKFDRDKYFQTYNEFYINNFINDLKSLYSAYGYNLVKIEYEINKTEESDQYVDLVFNIDEKTISKINKILFIGNNSFTSSKLRSIIKSKQRNLFKLFSNNNFKNYQIKEDELRLYNFYHNVGFKDVKINFQSEYIAKNNRLNLFFYIEEGTKYSFRKIKIDSSKFDLTDTAILNDFENEEIFIDKKIIKNNSYNPKLIEKSKTRISKILYNSGLKYFELITLEKIENNIVDIIIQIIDTEPKYVNQINIYGNVRTKEKVIRRELSFAEGDRINDQMIRDTKINLQKLGFF